MKAIFDDDGLGHSSSSFSGLVPRPGRRAPPRRTGCAAALRRRRRLGAHHVKVGNIPGDAGALEQVTERFAELCADAAEHHAATIAYEIMPFDPTSGRSTTGSRSSSGADAPNGGLAIDTWHMAKLGIAPEELRRIPPGTSAGSSSATAATRTWPTRSTRPSTTAGCPARASSTPRLRRRLPRARLPGAVGRRGALRGPAQPPDRRDLRPGIRDHAGPVSRRRARKERRGRSTALDRERLIWIFTQMLRIREFEERVKRTFEEHPGVIRGHTHLADGAEASIVGSLAALRDRRPADVDLPLPRLPDRARHRHQGDHGRDLRAHDRPVRRLRRLDAPRRPGRGFLGTSGIVGQGIPHATGAAYAAQIRGEGQVALSFFGDGASKQGAFYESLNIASLWKLPVVYVMENNSYNVVTRSSRRTPTPRPASRSRSRRRPTHARRHRRRRRSARGPRAVAEAVARARAGEGPTLVESHVYRLSAHGNIIAPPGVPLHYPEHEAITVFGNPRSTRPRCAATRCRASARAWSRTAR